jgi:hypothetical protein
MPESSSQRSATMTTPRRRKKVSAAHITPSTKAVGFWSAVLATAFSITYIVGQTCRMVGNAGSRGGPTSNSTPLGLVVLLTPFPVSWAPRF